MSIYLGDTPLANNNVSRNIGEIIQSTIPLSDAGLHLLDGALISSAGSYAKFVNYIAGLVTDYPDLFTTEADWQSSVSTYGVCGKFVYDSTNNTVRLPKITGFVEGTIDPTVLGDLVQAGLPNITGSFGPCVARSSGAGAFYHIGQAGQTAGIGGTDAPDVGFDASRSSSIYGNSTTVQPQSIKVLYYIVIASSITNELNLDVADLERSKADTDLSNVNARGTSLASGWSMPSSRYIDLTIGAHGSSYSAPANGWFAIRGYAASGAFLWLSNNANQIMQSGVAYSASAKGGVCIPCKKGDSVSIGYYGGALDFVRFVYAEGENV